MHQFIHKPILLTMREEKAASLKRLLADFPPGALLPTRWLTSNGYADNRLPRYVAGGWLARAGYGLYRRTGAEADWTDAVHALQKLLALPLHVGGLSALDWGGFAHYLRPGPKTIHLYGPAKPPRWAATAIPGYPLQWHSDRLFAFPPGSGDTARALVELRPDGARHVLRFASEERAFLELLDEVPQRASAHEADAILAGLVRLRPARVQALLTCCTSFKVKRLFLALAHRHGHPWLKHLDLDAVDLGRGKRSLQPGGRFDARFQISLPADLDGKLR
ncbi:type IV toxin-antitoxin system AbiEi family antitoxin domain-containing protein [Arenimonas composti]|nr:type IV toxin-antitoxin system AbiEi family antitoxin domain-containing protein [Arenimonas composti]